MNKVNKECAPPLASLKSMCPECHGWWVSAHDAEICHGRAPCTHRTDCRATSHFSDCQSMPSSESTSPLPSAEVALACTECPYIFTAAEVAAEDKNAWGHPCHGDNNQPDAVCESFREPSSAEVDKATHDAITKLLDGVHCPKHGVEWEACCFADLSLELHLRIKELIVAAVNAYQTESQCGHFKPSALGVPAPEDQCVKPSGHEGKHSLAALPDALPHPFDAGRVDTGICQHRADSEICGKRWDAAIHKVSALPVESRDEISKAARAVIDMYGDAPIPRQVHDLAKAVREYHAGKAEQQKNLE